MLSTQTRQQVEFLCERIKKGAPVEFKDMIWLQKWSERNPVVARMVRQARRSAIQGDNPSELDEFCQALDITEPDPADHLSGPQDPVTLANWFQTKQKWFRGTGSF